jgi:hypothetical protein
MPATIESRVNDLAIAQAAAEQRVAELVRQVGLLSPLTTQIVEVKGFVKEVQNEVGRVGERVEKIDQGILNRAKEEREDRRSVKIALYGLTGSILASVVGALVAILGHL